MPRDTALTEKQTYWLHHIQQCEQQKLAALTYCSEHQLKLSQFYSYKHDLRRKGVLVTQSKPAFVRAQVAPPKPHAPQQTTLTLTVAWRSFRLQLSIGAPT